MSKKLDPEVKKARKAQRAITRALRKIVEANGGKVTTVKITKEERKKAWKDTKDLLQEIRESQKNPKKSDLRIRSILARSKIINDFVRQVDEAHKRTAKSKRVFKGG